MKDLQSQPTRPQAEGQVTQKRPYAPPKASFVPLKLEERLLVCSKLEDCTIPPIRMS
jgi:hypothetical protein